MSFMSKLALLQEMLESAESSIRSAKQIIHEITKSNPKSKIKQEIDNIPDLHITTDTEGLKIIEGIFDGKNMIGKDKNTYPVPLNYSSKSKLVQGDLLKLSIHPDGSMTYKQIGPVPRKNIIGHLIYENGQYRVISEGKLYDVNMAAVTYFKGNVGDSVSLNIPKEEEADYGAIEAIIPQETIDKTDLENKKEKDTKKSKTKKTTKKKTKSSDIDSSIDKIIDELDEK